MGPFGTPHFPVCHVTPTGIPETNGLEGAVAHRVFSAPGKLFDGEAAFEEASRFLFEILECRLFRR